MSNATNGQHTREAEAEAEADDHQHQKSGELREVGTPPPEPEDARASPELHPFTPPTNGDARRLLNATASGSIGAAAAAEHAVMTNALDELYSSMLHYHNTHFAGSAGSAGSAGGGAVPVPPRNNPKTTLLTRISRVQSCWGALWPELEPQIARLNAAKAEAEARNREVTSQLNAATERIHALEDELHNLRGGAEERKRRSSIVLATAASASAAVANAATAGSAGDSAGAAAAAAPTPRGGGSGGSGAPGVRSERLAIDMARSAQALLTLQAEGVAQKLNAFVDEMNANASHIHQSLQTATEEIKGATHALRQETATAVATAQSQRIASTQSAQMLASATAAPPAQTAADAKELSAAVANAVGSEVERLGERLAAASTDAKTRDDALRGELRAQSAAVEAALNAQRRALEQHTKALPQLWADQQSARALPIASPPITSPQTVAGSGGAAREEAKRRPSLEAFLARRMEFSRMAMDVLSAWEIAKERKLPSALVLPKTARDSVDAKQCGVCDRPFSRFTRKHHCRLCCDVLCDACSPRETSVPGSDYTSERTCVLCYAVIDTFNAWRARRRAPLFRRPNT